MEVTLGGDRLGSGNKNKVDLHNYGRSTHDLSFVWRSSMSAGTLVPFMSKIALSGDTWEIDLNAKVMTHPTVGPLLGSSKVQLDVFLTPIRLYNSWLHNNKTGIGTNMHLVKLPKQKLFGTYYPEAINVGFKDIPEQIGSSHIFKYLG